MLFISFAIISLKINMGYSLLLLAISLIFPHGWFERVSNHPPNHASGLLALYSLHFFKIPPITFMDLL